MVLGIGCDHGGYDLKLEIINGLKDKGFDIIDYGTYSKDSCDYPIYAKNVSKAVQLKTIEFGILICTTGIGMSITANKFKGVRAALVMNLESAILTRQHNNSNVICLSAKYTDVKDALDYVYTFINTKFLGERHLRRVELISKIEEERN